MKIIVHRLTDETKAYICDLANNDRAITRRHDAMQAIAMIERAMNQAEREKAGVYINAEPNWTKELEKRETLIRKMKAAGLDTAELEQGAEIVKGWLAPTPGRQKGTKAAPRADGAPSRLAVAVADALKGCGIPCTGAGLKILEHTVAAVFGAGETDQIYKAISR